MSAVNIAGLNSNIGPNFENVRRSKDSLSGIILVSELSFVSGVLILRIGDCRIDGAVFADDGCCVNGLRLPPTPRGENRLSFLRTGTFLLSTDFMPAN